MNQRYREVYDQIFNTNWDIDTFVIQHHIQRLEEMEAIFPQGSSFFILVDTSTDTFPFISKNFDINIGLDREALIKGGSSYWINFIHPDDLAIWLQMLDDLMKYTMSQVKAEDRSKLMYTWNFRIKNGSGNYITVFEQHFPLIFDQDFKPVVGWANLTVIGDRPNPIIGTIKKLNSKNEYETVYSRNFSIKNLAENLTNREKDILRLIALNKSSKEIANLLNLSSHTVDTHRRNILKKLDASSTAELIGYYKANTLY